MAKRGWDLRKGRPASKFPARLIRTWLGHSLELKGYALRIENMPNPVNRGSNKPAQRKGSQVTSRVARKWIGLADRRTGKSLVAGSGTWSFPNYGFLRTAFQRGDRVSAPRNCLRF